MLSYELESVGFLGSDVHIFICSIGLAKQNVLFDGCVEENWFLHHVATLLTEGEHVIAVERFAIDCHFALDHSVETK